MAIPDFQSIMMPLLRFTAADKEDAYVIVSRVLSPKVRRRFIEITGSNGVLRYRN